MIRPNTQSLTLGFDDALLRNVPPPRPRNHGARRRIHKQRTRQQTDLFAGGGGATLGSRLAYAEMGMPCSITAINHNLDCVETQNLNHPAHLNLCTGVDLVQPRYLFRFEDLDALWASPSCTHHSSARGGSPINPQLRASVEQVVRWVRAKRPIVFWVENVKELIGYGPVIQMLDKKGNPLFLRNEGTEKKTKWVKCLAPVRRRPSHQSTRRWWADMAKLGLVPAFKADPRYKGVYFDRLIRKLRHEGYDVEWRVLNCADYGAPTGRKRLFIQGVRIGSGMHIVWPNPTHAKPDENGQVPQGMLPWVPMRVAIKLGIRGQSIFERPKPLSKKTIQRIIAGFLKFGLKQFVVPGKGTDTGRVADIDKPAGVVTTTARGEALIAPALSPSRKEGTPAEIPLQPFATPGFGEREGQTPRTHDLNQPAPVICATGHMHVTQPFVVKYRGTSTAASVDSPSPAVTASGTHLGYVEPFIVQTNHGKTDDLSDAAMRVKPTTEVFPTVCGNRGEWAVCEAFVTQVSHGTDKDEKNPHDRRVKALSAPMGALTTSNDWGLTHFVLSQQSGGVARSIDDVSPTVAASGAIHLIEAEIMHYALAPRTGYPSIIINGERRGLDFRHRMLDWPELAAIQSFPANYQFAGNKTSKIKQIGNAVPPLMARALVLAFWTQNAKIPPADLTVLEQFQLQAA